MRGVLTADFGMSLLFGGAFASAVFFQGFYTEFLCLTLALVVVWGLSAVWLNYKLGFKVPLTAVTGLLTVYWAWLAVSASWGRVGYQGTISFWWLGTLPLAFWIYTLSPRQEELWHHGYRWAVAIGVALAVFASCQWLIYQQSPNATFLNRQSLAALLNLVALPLAGYFLISKTAHIRQRWIFGAAIFLLAFGLSLIEGRGATIAGAIAFLLLVAVAWWHVPKRRVALLVGIVALAFLIGSQLGQIGIGQRLDTVVENPWEAGAARFVIWKQSWEMLKHAPWMGVGLGHYALYWPPYRDPSDTSDGFFVHNDYLQIWIEAGLPGLLLLLAVLISVLLLYVRAMRNATTTPLRKIEMTALFAGLLATAAHSFVDFNLYILSTTLLAGLVLGRLHMLAYHELPLRTLALVPSKRLSAGGYRLLALLLGAFVLTYCLTLGLASFEYQRGLKLAEESKWEDAYASLSRAVRYYPYADNVLMSKADLLRHLLTLATDPAQRKSLFDEAEELLATAETINPLRSQTYIVRAFFYEQNPAAVGAAWSDKVMRNYAHALALEPRGYQARYLYARFLLNQGRREEARRVLEEGVKYTYGSGESLIPYYAFTAQLRAQAGDREGAASLVRRIEEIKTAAVQARLSSPKQGRAVQLITTD